MSEPQAGPSLKGNMFLYNRPELLMREKHGDLGLTPAARPFAFAETARAIPLVAREFTAAQRNYPIIFADGEVATPIAVTGIYEDKNLFVKDDGYWVDYSYIPAYIRRYPFAFANDEGSDRLAVVIDVEADMVAPGGNMPLFDGEALSAQMQQAVDFCQTFERDRLATIEFCKTLKSLDLITQQEARFRAPGETEDRTIATYLAVDENKLKDLSDDTMIDLNKRGYLPLIHGHLMSQSNWRLLVERRANAMRTNGAAANQS